MLGLCAVGSPGFFKSLFKSKCKMSYVVIARRWRPQLFEDIIGQKHVSKTLSNAIANNRIAHSYIFTGPRGVGKTTTARILAKAFNCEKGPTPKPCNECASCKAITIGNSLDVLEIDGASNRGIDEIRNLRENIRFTPTMGKYRIYIIDEVHMLTKEAFNALLKTLEEPPEHAVFVFATTEIHRVPATILSRCQRFDFRRIPLKTIMDHLRLICKEDKIKIQEDALLQIAKKADGSMRDAQSILDQIISFSGGEIIFEHVAQALGVIHQDLYFEVTQHIREKDLKKILLLAQNVFDSGYDLNEFILGLEDHFRNILIARTMKSVELIEVSENYLDQYMELAEAFSENDLIAFLQSINETAQAVKMSQQPMLKFELGLVKLVKMPSAIDIEEILHHLQALKKKRQSKTVSDNSSVSYGEDAPPENSSPGMSLSLEHIRNKWPAILQEIHNKRPSLASVVEKAKPAKYANQILSLKFDQINSFEKNLVESTKKMIEQITGSLVGIAVTAEFEYNSIETESNDNSQKQPDVDKKKLLDEMKSKSELAAKIIEELDLEII